MKTFCLLEQGSTVNDPLTLSKREHFTTDFCDFYRLNWLRDDDPNSFLSQRGIVWSEGRSLLWSEAPKDYEYYVFSDDDIVFSRRDAGNVAERIRDLLRTYRPLSATFLDADRFGNPKRWNFLPTTKTVDEYRAAAAFPIAGFDQQVHVMSKSFADVMLPALYHGSGRATWYAQWVCFKSFPRKQLCLTGVEVFNRTKAQHSDELKVHHTAGPNLVRLFNRHVRDRSFQIDHDQIVANNLAVHPLSPDCCPVAFDLADLDRLYRTDNYWFRRRRPVIDNRLEYLLSTRFALALSALGL